VTAALPPSTDASVPVPRLGEVQVRVEYATFGRRLWALVLDVVLFTIVASLLAAIVGTKWAGELTLVLALLWFVGGTAEGGTIGKRLASLRVVRRDGSRVSLWRAFLREPVGMLLSALPLFGGFFWMLDEPRRRCWHDLIADTVVVRELRGGAPEWAAAPPWTLRDAEAAASTPPTVVAAGAPDEPRPPVAGDEHRPKVVGDDGESLYDDPQQQ
jgi:uncharacterized RDD family membrane protein YckC